MISSGHQAVAVISSGHQAVAVAYQKLSINCAMWLSMCKYDIHVYPPPLSLSPLYISSWLAVPYLEHTAALSHDRGEGEAEETARSKDITTELQTAFEEARLSLSRNQGQWPLH